MSTIHYTVIPLKILICYHLAYDIPKFDRQSGVETEFRPVKHLSTVSLDAMNRKYFCLVQN